MKKLHKTLKSTSSPRSLSAAVAAPVKAVKDGADMSAVAVSSITLLDNQLTAFASKISDDTLLDLDIGIEATEDKQRNPLAVMFDIQSDFENDLEALLSVYPPPYSEAPKDMTPAKWSKEKRNSPWLFDKWSERVSQSGGGKRNVNYVWYKEAYLKTSRGIAHAKALSDVQEQIGFYNAEKPLTGDYQKLELDDLQALEKKLARRITTASDNMRDAVALVRQFVAFAPHSNRVAFDVLREVDDQGNQVPTASRLPIRVQVVTEIKNASGGIDRQLQNKKPVSIDTFLSYDVARFDTLSKQAGKSVYDALLESKPVKVEEKETSTTIKLPLNDEKCFSVAGQMATYMSDDSVMSRLIKTLGERDESGAPKHAAEVRSFLDLHVATLPIHVAFRGWYDQENLSGSKLIKKAN